MSMLKKKILFGILMVALFFIAFPKGGIALAQPVPANTTPVYLPDIVDDPDCDNEEYWYQQFNGKENMVGFYSNYTNMFHWFGDMGINVVTHGVVVHHVIGYAYSPDGVNWAIDRHWGQGADLLDFAMSEDGTFGDPWIYDVVLEANGRYFWIVGLNTYHPEPLEIYARKGELHLNGSITWVAPVQTIIAADIGSKKVTWPIDAEVDSNGRLFVSFNAWFAGPSYTGYVRWTELTNGTWITSDTQDYDSLLDWNKGDNYREYLKLNRLAEGKMAWTGLFRDANPLWWAETVCFDGTNWIVANQHRLFSSGAAEGNRHRTWDIVSYGDRLIGTYVSRSVGFQRLFVKEAVYNGPWSNSTELISDLPELTGVNVAHLEVDHDGNAIIFFYVHDEDIVNYTYRYSNYTWQPNWTVLLNDSSANYYWNRFGFMDTTENYYPFWFQDNTDAFTELGFHYLVWGDEEELPLLFEHKNTTLYNSDGSVNDGWIFEGEVYDLESYIVGADQFYINTADSRHDIRFNWDNSTSEMWISVDPRDQFTIGLVHSEYERTGNITRLLWRFIPDRSIIDSVNQSWAYYLYDSDVGIGIPGNLNFTTNIYNLGGFTYYAFSGDGGRTTGGHPFEIYATNGADGSSARAEQIYRKLQHVHFLIEIDMDNEWEGGDHFDIDPGVGWVDIGIDYRLNATWVEGFSVRLYVQDADVGHHAGANDHNWIEWSVDWYNYDPGSGQTQNFRSNLIYSNHWGYENENLDPDYHNRTSSQIWVDLWFDRTNASTTVSGQVNAMYHGMREHGSAWWFGYGVFQPMISDYGNALMLDDLYDEGGNVTDSMKYDLMRVYVEVGKADIVDGNDETWTIRAIENYNRKQADDRMQGIEQPAFEETLVLDMPMFQSMNPLIRAIDGISVAIWKGALGFQKLLWGAMDSFFAWAGFGEGFFSQITAYLMLLPEIFTTLMDNMGFAVSYLITMIDVGIRMVVMFLPQLVTGMSWLSGSVFDYWHTFIGFLNGGLVDFSLIYDLQLGVWASAAFTMLPMWEMLIIMDAADPAKKAKERLGFYTGIFNGVVNFLKGLVSFMQGMISTIMDILPG